jgi:YesN/AraC family two-component response regulator
MSDMIKRFIFERVSENITTKPWMKACYRDYQTREIVMAAWPLNYAITLAWMLNLAWQRYRHRKSWIDRMVASEARLKIIQLERERDEAIRQLEEIKETKQELMQMVYGRNWVEQDLLKKINTWRKYAEKLVIYLRAFAPYPKLSEDEKKLLAEFDQLKEGAK